MKTKLQTTKTLVYQTLFSFNCAFFFIFILLFYEDKTKQENELTVFTRCKCFVKQIEWRGGGSEE